MEDNLQNYISKLSDLDDLENLTLDELSQITPDELEKLRNDVNKIPDTEDRQIIQNIINIYVNSTNEKPNKSLFIKALDIFIKYAIPLTTLTKMIIDIIIHLSKEL